MSLVFILKYKIGNRNYTLNCSIVYELSEHNKVYSQRIDRWIQYEKGEEGGGGGVVWEVSEGGGVGVEYG